MCISDIDSYPKDTTVLRSQVHISQWASSYRGAMVWNLSTILTSLGYWNFGQGMYMHTNILKNSVPNKKILVP